MMNLEHGEIKLPERKRSAAEELTEGVELDWPVFLAAERLIFNKKSRGDDDDSDSNPARKRRRRRKLRSRRRQIQRVVVEGRVCVCEWEKRVMRFLVVVRMKLKMMTWMAELGYLVSFTYYFWLYVFIVVFSLMDR